MKIHIKIRPTVSQCQYDLQRPQVCTLKYEKKLWVRLFKIWIGKTQNHTEIVIRICRCFKKTDLLTIFN